MSTAAESFERERRHLFGVAYRMLGSAAEAEDVLQDAWIRFADHGAADSVESVRAYLTTIVVRLCLDQMKSARARRETYVGPWLPEPLVTHEEPLSAADARVELAESLSMAFLVVLERLTPLERAAFLLREVFDRPFEEVATTLETSEAACRQLVSRARAHVAEGRPRHAASEAKKKELFQAFLTACAMNDPSALGAVLTDDVIARSDGGGKVHAALKPIYGRDRVVRFMLGVLKKGTHSTGVPAMAVVNGEPGFVISGEGGMQVAMAIDVDGDRIKEIYLVLNPDKLTPRQ